MYRDQKRGLHNTTGILFSVGHSIAPISCIFARNMVQAFPLLELCSRDVTTVKMTYTRGSIQNLLLPWHTYHLEETPPSEGLRKLLTFVVGINCSSSLNVMKMHTTIFGVAWTSIHEENA